MAAAWSHTHNSRPELVHQLLPRITRNQVAVAAAGAISVCVCVLCFKEVLNGGRGPIAERFHLLHPCHASCWQVLASHRGYTEIGRSIASLEVLPHQKPLREVVRRREHGDSGCKGFSRRPPFFCSTSPIVCVCVCWGGGVRLECRVMGHQSIHEARCVPVWEAG